MQKIIIGKCINYIKENTDYNEVKIKEIKYGLEAIYLTFTKIIFILTLAYILGIFKFVVIYTLIYNILRGPSFGLHATKSWICLVSSTILFIGIPYLCLYLKIPIYIKSIIGILGIIFMFKNSPADTYKKPIVSKKRREKYKFLSVILTVLFAFLSIFIKNYFLSNCLLFSIVMQNFMIAPTTYKIFKLPYNNYIKFLKDHPDFA